MRDFGTKKKQKRKENIRSKNVVEMKIKKECKKVK